MADPATLKYKVTLAYHFMESLLFLSIIIREIVTMAAGHEHSLRLDTRVALLAFTLMSIPSIINCFFGVDEGSAMLVSPYHKFMIASPLVNIAYVADLHLVSCSGSNRDGCGEIHGFKTNDFVLLLAIQIFSSIPFYSYFEEVKRKADREIFDAGKAKCYKLTKPPTDETPAPKGAEIPKLQPPAEEGSRWRGSRGVMRLARGFQTYEGTIKIFNERRGFGFVTLEGQRQDVYFKKSTLSLEIQALGEHMVGTQVEFIVRWMPDGTPQVRAAMMKKRPGSQSKKTNSPTALCAAGGVLGDEAQNDLSSTSSPAGAAREEAEAPPSWPGGAAAQGAAPLAAQGE